MRPRDGVIVSFFPPRAEFRVSGTPILHAFLKFLLPVWAAGIVITFFYNGKKGYFPLFFKYFFYAWYPLHLLLQWIFRLLAN